MEYEIVGAIKIKDGLFLGDEFAAQDLEFVVTNKVTHILNCAGKQVPNHWENIGVIYMTYNWFDSDSQILFDNKDDVVNNTFKFIDDTLKVHESVLVHSVRGQSRSSSIIAAYLMRRYRWTLYKTLEFLHSRRPDLEIRTNFFNQLVNLETKMSKNGLTPKTFSWNEIGDEDPESDEALLRNTFLNTRIPADNAAAPTKAGGSPARKSKYEKEREHSSTNNRIRWIDHGTGDKGKLNTLLIPADLVISNDKLLNKKPSLKSIVKGSGKVFELKVDPDPVPPEPEVEPVVKAPPAADKEPQQPVDDKNDADKKGKDDKRGSGGFGGGSSQGRKNKSSNEADRKHHGKTTGNVGNVKRIQNAKKGGIRLKDGDENEEMTKEEANNLFLELEKEMKSNKSQDFASHYESTNYVQGPKIDDPSKSPRGTMKGYTSEPSSLKNLLISGKDQKKGIISINDKNKVTRKDLIKMSEGTQSLTKTSENPSGTISFSSIVTPFDNKIVPPQLKVPRGADFRGKNDEEDSSARIKAPPPQTQILQPGKKGRSNESVLAPQLMKNPHVFSEPLKLPKYTIDSSVFSGMPPFKAPKVNNFLGGNGPQTNNNRSGPIKIAHELFDNFTPQTKFAPYIAGNKIQSPNVGRSNLNGSMAIPREDNSTADKARYSAYNVAFRPFTVPGKVSAAPKPPQSQVPPSHTSNPSLLEGGVANKRGSSSQPAERGNANKLDDSKSKLRTFSPAQMLTPNLMFSQTVSIYSGAGKNFYKY